MKWNKNKLETLYECWKAGNSTKERIPIIIEKLPKIPTPIAVNMMRKMARTDPKWLSWATRKNNEKEKEKTIKNQEKERKKLEREQKRKEREIRRIERMEKKQDLEMREKLSNLNEKHMEKIAEKIAPEFFFCPDIQQFVNNCACIYRVFNKGFPKDSACLKCKRMDKHIKMLEEIIDAEK